MQNSEVTLQVLAIDSCEDEATQIVHDYRNQYVYPDLESRGFRFVRCQGPSACRETVAPEACRADIAYITGSAHGSDTACFGYDGSPIFEVGNYQPEEVDGKVVHLLSCLTAVELGPDFVTNGCRAYFGYRRPFTFPLDFTHIFLECDSEIDWAFADGLTAEEVHHRVIALYDQKIAELKSELNDEMDIKRVAILAAAIATLENNCKYLCTPSVDSNYGDPQACILDSST